jgi:hypothetical protein
VWDVYPLKQTVLVELDNGTRVEVAHVDVQPWEELEALRKKAQEPCGYHEGGACTCGKHTAAAAAAPEEGQPPKTIEMKPPAPASQLDRPASQPGAGQTDFRKSRKSKRKKSGRGPRPEGGDPRGSLSRPEQGSHRSPAAQPDKKPPEAGGPAKA